MKPARPSYTVLLHKDGEVASWRYRVPVWAFRATLITGSALFVLVVVVAVLYAPIVRAAARVPALESELARLSTENAKVGQLVAVIDSLERQYDKVRRMLGADAPPATPSGDRGLVAPPVLVTGMDTSANRAGRAIGASSPARWPLDEAGYITRGQLESEGQETHPGLDIAVREGTVVRASGGGSVVLAGTDSVYGLTVVIGHPGGYESRYGHLSRLIARLGTEVQAGEVIGLSGNSGRSTAPHLHFEIRHEGRSIDPRTIVKERF